jgi:hypothetical protein
MFSCWIVAVQYYVPWIYAVDILMSDSSMLHPMYNNIVPRIIPACECEWVSSHCSVGRASGNHLTPCGVWTSQSGESFY